MAEKPKEKGKVGVKYDAHQGGGDTKIGENRVLSDEKSRCTVLYIRTPCTYGKHIGDPLASPHCAVR